MSSDSLLDENTRRYYLDAMGIQCWQSLEATSPVTASPVTIPPVVKDAAAVTTENNKDVVALNWSQLEQDIQQCRQCELHKGRKQAMSGRGNLSADLMIVLLSPSASDDADNIICGGEANTLLGKMLAAIDIDISDVYISSLLKCQVPQQHTISAQESQSCQHYLNQQIQLIQPKVLMVLGETTACCLLQKELSLDDYRAMYSAIDSQHEKLFYQTSAVPLFFSYSPEELLQQPEAKRKAWADLQQLQKIMATL